MKVSLIGASIVLLAKNHNPSIVSKDWLNQKGILTDNVTSFTHTPLYSVVETDNYSFIVDPDRLQLTAKNPSDDIISELPQKMLSYVQALPEIPYHAIGFNFVYNIETRTNILHKICLLDDQLKTIFPNGYKLGSRIEYKFNGFVATINLQPTGDENAVADINFHHTLELGDDMENVINMHSQTIDEFNRVMEGLIDN